MSKSVLITQSNYIPWKGYFDAINMADEFILLDEVQYTRRDWRNRNKIVTPNGLKWLTIPVSVSGKFLQTINETKVIDGRWRKSHWSLLKANYSGAPFFAAYAEILESLYLCSSETSLSKINETLIRAICAMLNIETKISRCEDYQVVSGKNERIIDLCQKSEATRYLTGPAAKAYLDTSLFELAGIAVQWLDYSGYPEYPQQFGAFHHQVTVLDLLFNTGERANEYMKSFSVMQ